MRLEYSFGSQGLDRFLQQQFPGMPQLVMDGLVLPRNEREYYKIGGVDPFLWWDPERIVRPVSDRIEWYERKGVHVARRSKYLLGISRLAFLTPDELRDEEIRRLGYTRDRLTRIGRRLGVQPDHIITLGWFKPVRK